MKSTIALIALAGFLIPGAATAQEAREWEFETSPPVSTYDQPPRLAAPQPQPPADAYPSFPYRPWRQGERQRYEPSTLAVYQVQAAPPNNCGPSLFEVVNPERDEAPCVALQRRRRWGH